MDDISREDFERLKKDAEERLMRMNRGDMPPFPNFVKIPERPTAAVPAPITQPSVEEKHRTPRFSSIIKYLNIPEMLKNSDALLLLSLILLLSNESSDETLILALAYILL